MFNGSYRLTEVITIFVLEKLLKEDDRIEGLLLESLIQVPDRRHARSVFETFIAYRLSVVLQDPAMLHELMQQQELQTSQEDSRNRRTRTLDSEQAISKAVLICSIPQSCSPRIGILFAMALQQPGVLCPGAATIPFSAQVGRS
jgi:hypothetical protein